MNGTWCGEGSRIVTVECIENVSIWTNASATRFSALSPMPNRGPPHVLPGAFPQAVADAGTFFCIEMPALEEWGFTEADAERVTQPVLAVLAGDGHTLWSRWAGPVTPVRSRGV